MFKRYSESLALGYVAARLVEGTFIAIGVVSLLPFVFMRQQGTAGTDAALGEAFVAIYDWAFLVGPGILAGIASGMILGYLMYRSGLVPRGLAMLAIIGGRRLSHRQGLRAGSDPGPDRGRTHHREHRLVKAPASSASSRRDPDRLHRHLGLAQNVVALLDGLLGALVKVGADGWRV
ncbi:DUF4386 domain-containing protein [Actinoplanes sp. CA-051413]|uniref:DUF4386 domain-containing protein n=1 Tax=Actinoplanes sp. CA-051413 TaxID=3239899 RepID=UPI003D97216C